MGVVRRRPWANNSLARRNRILSLARYGIGAGRAIARTARFARSFTRTRSSRPSSDPPPLTGEHDYRNVYRKKRMPYGKKRKWKSFKRKVNAVIDKRIGTQCVKITTGSQVSAGVSSQGGIADHVTFNRYDLREIRDRAYAAGGPYPTGVTEADIRYVISGTFTESTHTNVSANTIFIDLYYWRTKRDVPTAEFSQINSLFGTTQGRVNNFNPTTGAGGSPLDPGDLGWTPFVSPAVHKFLEIYNKRRVKVSPGGVFQITQRSSNNRYIKADAFMDAKSLVRGLSHGVYMIMYGAPTTDVGVNGQAGVSALSSVYHKTYFFKVLQTNWEGRGELRIPGAPVP